ncbi:hypothetical protein G3260_001801 [Streptomyces albus]|uniref:hypothetical protein n=1 Tax=Streptomyces albus TaxID=1888 RepID=UPI0013B49740|nr:hypothetical protein [Streptomyces albus]QID35776.1 hypothetical protein G3260_001801 [Streptomyces albus]
MAGPPSTALPHSTPGPARTLAGRLRRAAREHRDGETLFTADPDGTAAPSHRCEPPSSSPTPRSATTSTEAVGSGVRQGVTRDPWVSGTHAQ